MVASDAIFIEEIVQRLETHLNNLYFFRKREFVG